MNDRQQQPKFIPGLKLAEGFFHDEVEPILKAHYPGLPYSAGLIGTGSEVLGFDTDMSTDHHWGPRVMLFLRPNDFKSKKNGIRTVLSNELPPTYLGYSTNYSAPEDNGVQLMQPVTTRPVNHRVEMNTFKRFFRRYMNIDIDKPLDPLDWLTLPHQKLRTIIAGGVFHDDLGLDEIRARFDWYPHDVWLYILASAWKRIGQEEHLMGRAGFVGDEIGSALIGARLVRDVMRLAFLMERQYPPYAKWFGTAFSQLKCAGELNPLLVEALHATSWQERESHLCPAYEILAKMHNDLKITEPVSTEAILFWGRPFRIIRGDRIANAILERVTDPEIVKLTKRGPFGSIDMFSDSTDLLGEPAIRVRLKTIYR